MSRSPRSLLSALAALAVAGACTDELRAAPVPACGPWRGGGWDPSFALPGFAGPERAEVTAVLALPDGRLVAAGPFDQVNGRPILSPALWDGTAWSSLGRPRPNPLGREPLPPALHLALDAGGRVWAAGARFVAVTTSTPSAPVGDWDSLAVDIGGASGVLGVEAIGDAIAVFGDFPALGGQPAGGLAVWRAGAWRMPALMAGSVVTAVLQDGDRLCAAGGLRALDGSVASVACERADGTWEVMGDPLGGVVALARGPGGALFAGGSMRIYLPDGTRTGVGIARLETDGRWTPLDGGLHGGWDDETARATRLLADGDGLLVAGHFGGVGPSGAGALGAAGLARWSAAAGWQAVVPGKIAWGGVNTLARRGDDLVIAGTFASIDGVRTGDLAVLGADGGVAGLTEVATSGLFGVATYLAPITGGVVASGELVGGMQLFDGAWHGLPAGGPAGTDGTLVELTDGSWVVAAESAMRWDGVRWSTLLEGARPVAALDDAGVLLARASEPVDGAEASDMAAWRIPLVSWRSGAREAIGDLVLARDEWLVALAVFDGAAHALIAIEPVDGTQGTRVVRVGADAQVELFRDDAAYPLDLRVSPRHGLVIATTTGLHTWDGARWQVLATGRTTAIATCADGVFAADLSTAIDAPFRSRVRFHDGAAWASLGPDLGGYPAGVLDGWVSALAATPDGLFVGASGPRQPAVRRWRRR